MQTTKSDETSLFKLAQIWQVIDPTHELFRKFHSRKRIIDEILKNDFNVNLKFTINNENDEFNKDLVLLLKSNGNRLKDYTPLHFAYDRIQDIDTFTTFIERGADFTMKNGDGMTAVHLIIKNFHNYIIHRGLPVPFLNAALSAHVTFQNSTNPRDDHGVSHIHGACIANHVEAVELFLTNGTSIEETVNSDAPEYAGWTPMHFAAAFGSFQVAQVLIERGANVNSQTVEGRSPIDQLFENRFIMQEKTADKEQFKKLLLKKGSVSAIGLSSLHIACTLKDLTIAKRLLDEGANIEYAVPKKSIICPGNTALHFAAHNSMEAIVMLLKRGAKIDATNAKKETPLELCKFNFSIPNLCSILSCIESLKAMRLSDNQTKLLDLITAMENVDKFKQFLQKGMTDIRAVVPKDSFLWPGYSILHLAVTFTKKLERNAEIRGLQYDKTIVQECLDRGLSVDITNLEEKTPIHLAIYERKSSAIKLMFEHLNQLDTVVNCVDKNNLSYLHIACYVNDEPLVDRLLRASYPKDSCRSIVQPVCAMSAGSTPLHAAVASRSRTIAERLLEHGADLHATDADGMTPIHLLCRHMLIEEDHEIANFLLGSLLTNITDRVVDGVGLSYLHIACAFGNAEVARKLLDIGSDVNATIKCDDPTDLASTNSLSSNSVVLYLDSYSNYTPLQMISTRVHHGDDGGEVVDTLLRHGADIFAGGTNRISEQMCTPTIPYQNPRVLRRFFQVLLERDDMQKSMQEKLGLTKLHIACYLKNEEAIRSALNDVHDINTRIKDDSKIFPGCTPLHLLLTVLIREDLLDIENLQITISNMVKMLIDRGADVTIANAKNATPIHVFRKNGMGRFLEYDLCMSLLLEAHGDYGINPVNAEGISHFHLACEWHEVEVIDKFLQHGSINVNQPVDFFVQTVGGCTPLHLALKNPMVGPNDSWTKLSQTVDLLLKYGANVTAKDIFGDTPLHKPATLRSPGMCILEKLVSYGGDIKCENIQGQTPIERFMSMGHANPSDNLTIFKKYGYQINSWNRLTGEGYIAKIFPLQTQPSLSENSEFKKFLESSDVRSVDDMGRTAIHNVVAHSGNLLLGPQLMDPVLKNHMYAITSFIKIRIDIDHRDKSGQTALHYAARMENLMGVKALLACGADVNIVDNTGKSAYSYAVEQSKREGAAGGLIMQPGSKMPLRLHIEKLQHLKIEVNQLNQNLAKEANLSPMNNPILRFFGVANKLSQEFYSQVEMTKTLDVGTNSLTLFDFLSETGAVNLYPVLLTSERDVVDHFFASIDYNELTELVGIIHLQSQKMKTRLGLIDSALSSLRILLGFSVPGLCEQISRFLLNSDLKNLIESTALKARKRKLSELSN